MSVFFDHRRRHGDDEPGAFRGRRDEDGSLWGFAYDRVEGVVHLTLAFTIVGGAAVILSSALFSPGAPLGARVEKPVVAKQASPAPAVSVVARQAPAPVAREPAPVPDVKDESAPAAPVQQAERAIAAPAAPLADARSITETAAPAPAPAVAPAAPMPLAPPSADIREKLSASQYAAPAPAPAEATAAPPAEMRADQAAPAPAPANLAEAAEEAPSAPVKAEAGGRMAKCYLKLSGKVQTSGACRVDHAGENVVFHLPGKPLELVHDRGRVWTATLGGRNLGKVYKNKDAPCWGAKGFYACENS